jgi:hypothetical protein
MKQVQAVHNALFRKLIPIIVDGQKQSASQAVVAFSETDRSYLEAAFGETGRVNSFIDGQRQQAMLGVVHTLSRINKSDQPLSSRVYRTRSLANNVGLKQCSKLRHLAEGEQCETNRDGTVRHIDPSPQVVQVTPRFVWDERNSIMLSTPQPSICTRSPVGYRHALAFVESSRTGAGSKSGNLRTVRTSNVPCRQSS